MNKAEAIQRSIRKWECLCGSQLPIRIAVYQCSLCKYVTDDGSIFPDCDRCILALVERCTAPNATWDKIDVAISYCKSNDTYLSDNPHLCDLFEKMLDLVLSLEE